MKSNIKTSHRSRKELKRGFITEGPSFFLQNNFIGFSDNIYKHISGSAMVKNEQSKLKCDLNFLRYLIDTWKGYLDDCLILWTHTFDQIIEFKALINSINSDIQFKMVYNQGQFSFLHILILK